MKFNPRHVLCRAAVDLARAHRWRQSIADNVGPLTRRCMTALLDLAAYSQKLNGLVRTHFQASHWLGA